MTFAGHAYPWDVLGDSGFCDRVAGLGLDSVTLAAAYHSVRAATPLHPKHQLVDARHAALYRPVRPGTWSGRLQPGEPDWVDSRDGFGDAAHILADAGIPVNAWIVLTHSTRLGRAHPDLTVRNCFGETYPYALCPSHAEVRDYAATLAAESVRDVPVASVSLEACGQLGLGHIGHHEKTDGAWTPAAQSLLSVCACDGCAGGWTARGLDPEHVRQVLRDAVWGEAVSRPTPPSQVVRDVLLDTRHAFTDTLRRGVISAVRDVAPHVAVTLHANPDPWATGPSVGITAATVADVDAILVPAWPTTSASADTVAAVAGHGRTVDAYVTVLPPTEQAAVAGHIRRLADAGATRFSLYHLGLAPTWRQSWFTDMREALT